MRTISTVVRKELIDLLRDRRTLMISLLIGPLLVVGLVVGMGFVLQNKVTTQMEKTLELPVIGAEHAPNLMAWLRQHNITPQAPPADPQASILNQDEDVILRVSENYGEDWRAGRPALIEILHDSTRDAAEIPVMRVTAVLQGYAQQVAALRLLARGVNPGVGMPVMVAHSDLATPSSRVGKALSFLPYLLIMSAFLGGAYLLIDATAGERERQSLEPLLTTPAAREALVSGKMLAAAAVGITGLLLTLVAFKLSATLVGTGMAKMMDVSLSAIAQMLLVLLPLVLIGTALLTALSSYAKSMKEAQANLTWLMFLPMLPAYALMAYPIKDTALWQYAVPFLSQNQMLSRISRGDAIAAEQWGVYLAAALLLATLLWLAAVWRYKQEKLAISS